MTGSPDARLTILNAPNGESVCMSRNGLEVLRQACEFKHLARGHYPPIDGPYWRSTRLRVYPVRRIDLRRAGIGGFNMGPPMQQIPRRRR